jgi:multidrug efflux system membrane fusion protein
MKLKLLLLALFFCFCGCSSKKPAVPPRTFPVIVDKAIQRDVPVNLSAIGTVSSPWLVEVRSQVSGKLLETHAGEGAHVNIGDLLFVIDAAPFQAELDKAVATLAKDEALLEFAKKKVERYVELAKKDYVSALNYEQFQTDVKTITAQVELDKAAVKTAEINLAYTHIASPSVGRVGRLPVDAGNLVSPTDATPLTYIRQISPINVKFSVPQKDFLRIQDKGLHCHLPVQAILKEHPEPITNGMLTFVDNTFDTSTGTVELKASFPNTDRLLWPGEFVRVLLNLGMINNAILVPSAAIQYGQPGTYLYVVKEDNTVELRVVKVGEEIEEYFVIYEGVQPGEIVVTDGQINLRNGASVVVQTKDPAT